MPLMRNVNLFLPKSENLLILSADTYTKRDQPLAYETARKLHNAGIPILRVRVEAMAGNPNAPNR